MNHSNQAIGATSQPSGALAVRDCWRTGDALATPEGDAAGNSVCGIVLMDKTVSDLLAKLPEGEVRFFEAPIKGAVENDFFSIHVNFYYSQDFNYINPADFSKSPRANSRNGPGSSVFLMDEPQINFAYSSKSLVDYYWSNNGHFMSDLLAGLIEEIDPRSIERRHIEVKTRDGNVPFNVVMPKRVIEAVDVQRTNVLLKSKHYVRIYRNSVSFPDGAVFDHKKLIGVENFIELDCRSWFWSRKLIDAAKAAGVRGLCTKRPAASSAQQVDQL